ncbi:LOW QUALITY PROTEIN: activator of Hsp90 ATPase [Jimgerdemannia flammicorona]|uniref:Activator of Hsp90 ATPase n=1 Tax=Jimgerdemannia flammicorona TaxID=994334 RepID=A0A433D999_9FUNG|nr:LOW QUALITY PROTEIN: activator of Hsp90 ATPase [Jimgerdemannia flammicorona]
MSNWKNVNNWVNKNCLVWAKDYFNEQLVDITVDENGATVKTDSVTEVTGDCDLNQRKGKIITIFDVQMTINWSGSTSDGTEVKGKIQIPEVAHDTNINDYVFDITVFDEKSDKQPVRELIRKELTPLLRKKLANFSQDLIDAHAKDVYIDPEQLGQAPPPRLVHAETVGGTRVGTSTGTPEGKPAKVINTTTHKETIEFQTSAHDMYETLLDVQRVQAWTRGSAKISREPGSQFELFGGNVTGEIVEVVSTLILREMCDWICTQCFESLVPDKKIVQKWRLKSWPEGGFYRNSLIDLCNYADTFIFNIKHLDTLCRICHHSTVTFTFDQLSESVNLHITQTDVPVGEKDQTQHNWTGYYWSSIKSTFGYVIIPPEPGRKGKRRASLARKGKGKRGAKAAKGEASSLSVIYTSAGFVLLTAFSFGVYRYLYSSP